MPQPAITGVPLTCRFGGLPLPNGQGAMSQVNLNDLTSWAWQDYQGDDDYVALTIGQLAWRGRSTVLGRDRRARTLSLPMRFNETNPGDFGAAKAVLTEAGQQRLTFDTVTAILANLSAVKSEGLTKRYAPFQWTCTLEFLCPDPYFSDLTPTTYVNALALTSGVATTANVTYAGSVRAEPVWTLAVPNTNAVPIQSLSLSNVMAGETLTVTFPGSLAALTAWTITVDSGAYSVADGSGKGYDAFGTFPLLHGPAGQVQQVSATVTPASGTATGCTLTCVATNRWVI